MTDAITPFTLTITDAEIDDLRQRLRNTRWPDPENIDDWSQGIPLEYTRELCAHWADSYDMQRLANRLNAYPQFTTNIDGVDIHFMHIRSRHENARPLIMTHGWPGSVVEFLDVIGPLTDPEAHGGSADQAFHLVLPSLPGFGFSGKPTTTGWGVEKIAATWNTLMQRLGYPHYFAQGGDWGSIVTSHVGALENTGCSGLHINMAWCAPVLADPPDEKDQRALAALQHYDEWDSGYSKQQSTRPQTLGYGLSDSPSGQLAWIVEKFWSWTDSDRGDGKHPENAINRDALLDNVMVYWLSNSSASSARLYWHSFRNSSLGVINTAAGVSVFPHDIMIPPRRWIEPMYTKLVYWNELDKGGHFAAMEQPGLFVAELRNCFGQMSI